MTGKSVSYPINNQISYDSIYPNYKKYINKLDKNVEPNNYTGGAKDKNWIEAKKLKLKSLRKMKLGL